MKLKETHTTHQLLNIQVQKRQRNIISKPFHVNVYWLTRLSHIRVPTYGVEHTYSTNETSVLRCEEQPDNPSTAHIQCMQKRGVVGLMLRHTYVELK